MLHFAALVQCAIFLLCYFGLCISVTLCCIAWFSVQCFFCAILVCVFLLHYAVLQYFFCAILVCVFLLHYAVLHGLVCNISFVLFWFVYFCVSVSNARLFYLSKEKLGCLIMG